MSSMDDRELDRVRKLLRASLRHEAHPEVRPADLENLIDGTGTPESRRAAARAILDDPRQYELMLSLVHADNEIKLRNLETTEASSSPAALPAAAANQVSWFKKHRRHVFALAAGVLLVLGVRWMLPPQRPDSIGVHDVASMVQDGVSSFRTRAGDQLEFLGDAEPGQTLVWVGRPFNDEWTPRFKEARASELVPVDTFIKKPGKYLIVVTTGSAMDVDPMVASLNLPKDLASRSLDEAAGILASAVRGHPLPPGMTMAVCEFLN